MKTLYADIAVPVPVDRTFTYIVPPELHAAARVGCRALVPFGRRHLIGYIVSLADSTSLSSLKPVRDIMDDEPTMTEELLQLTRWVGKYYFAPWGEVLKAATPRGLVLEGRRSVRLRGGDAATVFTRSAKKSKQRQEILKQLKNSKRITIATLQKKVGSKSIYALLNEMAREGLIEIDEEIPRPWMRPRLRKVVLFFDGLRGRWMEESDRIARRAKKQAQLLKELIKFSTPGRESMPLQEVLKLTGSNLSVMSALVKKGLVKIEEREEEPSWMYDQFEQRQAIILNAHQEKALAVIHELFAEGEYRSCLLHGVTGSGKTQVYIEAIRTATNQGKTAIVLVPEISLTPQIVRRFKLYLDEDVAVMHSRMSVRERYDAWRMIQRGRYRVVIGARSAVFAPLRNLGVIVVDEEQEASYKQYDAVPKYHARDVALMRASYCRAVVILGSATPSMESYYNARSGKYILIELPERVDRAKLPHIGIVDMTEERRRAHEAYRVSLRVERKSGARPPKLTFGTLSPYLKEKIADRLQKQQGVILLQNRRGFAPYLECLDCGQVEQCANCNVSLTYHLVRKQMRCHYCGSVRPVPDECAQCRGRSLEVRGIGTQRVEEELKREFPSARILRMDLDTTAGRGSHDRILKTFMQGSADLLLGTQMVAKGLDISHVTLVGVISADTQMRLPDFRSSERTFQLLTQVAGRAGRRSIEGEVIIQTSQLQHYCFKYVLEHDFVGFYEEELEMRRELCYPPFGRLALVEFKGQKEIDVESVANEFARLLGSLDRGIEKLGPAPAAISRIRRNYRYHLLLKGDRVNDPSGRNLHDSLRKTQQKFQVRSGVQLTVDIDPQSMM